MECEKMILDPAKLSVPLEEMRALRILSVGAGSLGSLLCSLLVQIGAEHLTLIDPDRLEARNLAKSALYTGADVGDWKAPAAARHLRELMPAGEVTGIRGLVQDLGPAALAGFDYLFVGVDNYAAKLWINRLWKQIPLLPGRRRPRLVLLGTMEELSSAALLDGEDSCLECYLGEMREEDTEQRRRCGVAYGTDTSSLQVQTSVLAGMASVLAGIYLLLADLRGESWCLNRRFWLNGRTKEPRSAPLTKTRGCKACSFTPPTELLPLEDCSVLTLTAEKALERMERRIGPCRLHLPYGSPFLLRDYCRACGKPMELTMPARRVTEKELLCPVCLASGAPAVLDRLELPLPDLCTSLTVRSDPGLLNFTLFRLGFGLGDFLYAETGRDFTCFFCANDESELHSGDDKEW